MNVDRTLSPWIGSAVLPCTCGVLTSTTIILFAHQAEPDNELLLADYALFLWRELNEWQQAEQMLEKALALPATSARVRMRILNLYSHFLSTTPISDSKLDAHRNGSYMNSSSA